MKLFSVQRCSRRSNTNSFETFGPSLETVKRKRGNGKEENKKKKDEKTERENETKRNQPEKKASATA